MRDFIRYVACAISAFTLVYFAYNGCSNFIFLIMGLFALSVFLISFVKIEVNKNYNINMTDSPKTNDLRGASGGFHVTKRDLTLIIVAFSIALVASFVLGVLYGADTKPQNVTQTQSITINQDKNEVSRQIDINNASIMELMTLDGIGEVKAKLIIEGAPYKTIYALLDEGIIGEDTFFKIKEEICVGN